jgi:excisionase family DNA binding protein
MEASWDALAPVCFRDMMQEAKDIAATKGPRRLSRGVTYKRGPLIAWYTVEEAAADLGVSGARVRVLCDAGRIPGARRKRGTRPWRIPARLQADGTNRIEVTAASKGPAAKFETVGSPKIPF